MRPRQELGRMGRAIKETLSSKQRWFVLLILTASTYALFLYIPVRLTPGNDLPFQLSIMKPTDHLLFVLLGTLNSLLILMHWQIFQTKKIGSGVGHLAISGAGGLSAAFASVIGTATCSACVAGLLGFLGTGSILFVINNRLPFTIVAVLLVISALYLASSRLAGTCRSCKIG